MATINLTKTEADTLSSIIYNLLDSGYEEDASNKPDAISQRWINLGVKAVEAGASLRGSHDYVQAAISKKRRRK
ncbi:MULTISPECIES: hypothetical protein [Vibrio]|uniref:hypothetical protein n=1 Tax=Vibrio TaxID=662 RepID=UPI002076080E|nr:MULTISPECIES: hypothetical protein [Vibrio]USD35526.1 hypothetical protein J8Z27_23180 [Vibrio sp. SCSIO 43186]USD72650.1 hypothetical protein J4N41_23185 [Vibrio sp. SCSIO 43139]USD98861.1 hypothetical protein CTT30_22525 [Vibrio coralliilyticus]